MSAQQSTFGKTVSKLILVVACFALIAWAVNQATNQSPTNISDAGQIIPEMIFSLKPMYVICDSQASLDEITAHIGAGEKTLANAMLFSGFDGDCLQSQYFPDQVKWKVLSVNSSIVEFKAENLDEISLDTPNLTPISAAAYLFIHAKTILFAAIGIVNPVFPTPPTLKYDVPPLQNMVQSKPVQSNDRVTQERAAWEATLAAATSEVRTLLLKELKLNDICRNGISDKDGVQIEAISKQVCDQRDAVVDKLKTHGWCWGSDDPNQVESDKQWQLCGEH